MQDNQPGAPPTEPEKPKVITDKVPHFSYRDLLFDDAFTSENRKFLRFIVDNEHPCFVEMLQIEFLQFQQLYFEQYDKQVTQELCSCDGCFPLYDLVSEEKFVFQLEKEGGEIEEQESTMPVYYVYGLPDNFKIGIHSDNHKEILK